VGLNSTWDNSKQANPNVPSLNQAWGSYTNRPFRGVNLGGWLSLEPFITPSLFESDSTLLDEYTLCTKLGPQKAAATLEKHYSTFITEDDFKSIAAAGLDHVRIPYSYWAIKVYDNDPYVFGKSWRYLLRGIEWARKYGLRVKLDLHAAPGSQNGWNHSGKSGSVDWIMGPDGAVNAQRTLDLHNQLSRFFAQDRYKNIVAFYGLINEPAVSIPQDQLIAWTAQAYTIVQKNGMNATQIFSESMRGLPAWAGKLTGYGNDLAIDVHLYSLFDDTVIGLKHADRVTFACKTWTAQVSSGMTGFGPTMVGEWSQADTDCTKYLNGVGNGARWTGTFGNDAQPQCPTGDSQCSCDMANADPSMFTADYKQFLLAYAEAQMFAFETSWGWFYWTWKTESAPLWSYQAGLQGNFLPPVAYQRDWNCSMSIPSFGALPEYY
jgi:glucan 1,3-beta-glucosidase